MDAKLINLVGLNGEKCVLVETPVSKHVRSKSYNYDFDKKSGFFARWGVEKADDPEMAPSPEILDIEVTTICNGVAGVSGIESPCKFCYKSNTKNGVNMSLETFKTILDKFPPSLTQIAFGADAHATNNPDLFKMMEYTREKGIIPNITVADISDETADKLAKLAGAVAISRYANKNICYDSVKRLTDRGMTQCNIHAMISLETYDQVKETLSDTLTDPLLAKLNAVVLLSLKPKGRGTVFNRLSQEQFTELVKYAFENKIRIGFDSCGCGKFLRAVKDHPDFENLQGMSESCESFGLFSSYIDVEGNYFPCSFSPGEGNWTEGISVVKCDDFIKDVWNNPKLEQDRKRSLCSLDENKCRQCLLFEI